MLVPGSVASTVRHLAARVPRRLALVLSALLVALVAAAPAAVTLSPATATTLSSHKGCDGPATESDWPWNDGNDCFVTYYYANADNTVDIDRYDYWFNRNNWGNSDDAVISLTGIHVSVYWGDCSADTAHPYYPACLTDDNGTIHGPVCGSDMPDMTFPYPSTATKQSGCHIDHKHAFVVIDYTAYGKKWNPTLNAYSPVYYNGRETSQL